MFNEKELKALQDIYEIIGKVLDGKPEKYDEEYLCFLLNKLYD